MEPQPSQQSLARFGGSDLADSDRALLADYLETRRTIVDEALARFFPAPQGWPGRLHEAQAWPLFGGGKRLRPVMTVAAFEAVGGEARVPVDAVLPAACALEMVHTYSLVHDDMPCMDDDDERRGRATVHVKFGEAMALLAGDALLTEAFSLVLDPEASKGLVPASQMVLVAQALARAAGPRGMVGGQSSDLGFEGPVEDEQALRFLHGRKTGELFRFALFAGGTLGGGEPEQLQALVAYAEALGLAFQISDDVLDELEDQGERTEEASPTPSFPGLIGIDASRERAAALLRRCLGLLEGFDERADPLRALAWFAVHRDH
jgi:geranylgeranyl diphosphate synthase, type II